MQMLIVAVIFVVAMVVVLHMIGGFDKKSTSAPTPAKPLPQGAGSPSTTGPQTVAPMQSAAPDLPSPYFGLTVTQANEKMMKEAPAGVAFDLQFDRSQSAPLTAEEQDLATRIMKGDPALMAEYQAKYGTAWLTTWEADQNKFYLRLVNQTATAEELAKLSGLSGQDAWDIMSGKNNPSGANYLNALKAMTPAQRQAFLDQWPAGSYDRVLVEGSLAAQGVTVAIADTGRRWDGTSKFISPWAPAVPVYRYTPWAVIRGNQPGEAFPGLE